MQFLDINLPLTISLGKREWFEEPDRVVKTTTSESELPTTGQSENSSLSTSMYTVSTSMYNIIVIPKLTISLYFDCSVQI